jgi:DNA-binding response OmpR family regulator
LFYQVDERDKSPYPVTEANNIGLRKMDMSRRILVVDDERIVTEVVARYLRGEGFEVAVAEDGQQALDLARRWPPELVVLDLMLPTVDGLEVFRQLRQERQVPVIMDETDWVVGLELGADDYVVKPFSPRELVARVKSVLRRSQHQLSGATLRCADLTINPQTREVTLGGRPITLTAKEFDLLYFLASHPNQVFTREQLVNQVWDYDYASEYSTVTVHIRRLRAKIEADPLKPRYIKTLWGIGYKFEGEELGHNI